MLSNRLLNIANGLSIGQRLKTVCECSITSGSKSMLISRSVTNSIHAHCFRCGLDEFVSASPRSLTELTRDRETFASWMAQDRSSTSGIELPTDFTLDIPTAGRLWFLTSGISVEIAKKYGIGWSKSLSRVILPVYGPEPQRELLGFCARRIGNAEGPKYINRTTDASVVFCSSEQIMLPIQSRYSGPIQVVVTEDALSAIRVGRLVNARALLGTQPSPEKLLSIVGNIDKGSVVAVWLDGDKAGRKGRNKTARRLSLLGMKPVFITTQLDPKRYSNREILEILHSARHCTPSADEGT